MTKSYQIKPVSPECRLRAALTTGHRPRRHNNLIPGKGTNRYEPTLHSNAAPSVPRERTPRPLFRPGDPDQEEGDLLLTILFCAWAKAQMAKRQSS
ncbi:hypothetical protein HZA86_01685 [Candidatus Uhrbacteria bacterium]|nr:hypothetical protein [Candidatus Uhrbacteria bacterium]